MSLGPDSAPSEGLSQAIEFDPLQILLHASGPVLVVDWLLLAAALAVWIVAVLKLRQLARLRAAEEAFQREAERAHLPTDLLTAARRHAHHSPGARVALAAAARDPHGDLLEARAERALLLEEEGAYRMLGLLATVGSAAPFVGLFGTVWGILEAFLRIGQEKSASLAVVAPAVGEALISTAVGLFAAIPAVVAFNMASKRAEGLLSRVEAGWVGSLVILRRSAIGEPWKKASSERSPLGGRAAGEEQWAPP